MDFNKFDARTKAENGFPMQILDPDTLEPVFDGDKPCQVLVRGLASPTFQAAQRDRARKALERSQADGSVSEEDRVQVLEDAHNDMIESALPFIAGFVNVNRGGTPCTGSEEDIRWFLNLTFPELRAKVDEEGNPVLQEVKDDEGNVIASNPVFEPKGKTFATQVLEFANNRAVAKGNSEAG